MATGRSGNRTLQVSGLPLRVDAMGEATPRGTASGRRASKTRIYFLGKYFTRFSTPPTAIIALILRRPSPDKA
jgi:hypothetical protein